MLGVPTLFSDEPKIKGNKVPTERKESRDENFNKTLKK
jgi:hypothetical protein